MGFMAAMRNYFGVLPGQTTMQFGQELSKLNMDERNWFYPELKREGVECDPPIPLPSTHRRPWSRIHTA